jgi:hypothetical protein
MDDQLASILIKYQDRHEKSKLGPDKQDKSWREIEVESKHEENLRKHKEILESGKI